MSETTSLKAHHGDTVDFLRNLNDESVRQLMEGQDIELEVPPLITRAKRLVKESNTNVTFLIKNGS